MTLDDFDGIITELQRKYTVNKQQGPDSSNRKHSTTIQPTDLASICSSTGQHKEGSDTKWSVIENVSF